MVWWIRSQIKCSNHLKRKETITNQHFHHLRNNWITTLNSPNHVLLGNNASGDALDHINPSLKIPEKEGSVLCFILNWYFWIFKSSLLSFSDSWNFVTYWRPPSQHKTRTFCKGPPRSLSHHPSQNVWKMMLLFMEHSCRLSWSILRTECFWEKLWSTFSHIFAFSLASKLCSQFTTTPASGESCCLEQRTVAKVHIQHCALSHQRKDPWSTHISQAFTATESLPGPTINKTTADDK